MADNGLSAPGSSSYDSSTLVVGDGTWDSSRNSFLLPNLQGLNFDTMRYNGMGNRFRDLPQYHTLILGHGVLAAITFIFIVPAAIFIARFYHAEGRFAYKAHVYLQILTVFLTTVIFALGWFAVGPDRSLTNPHHGIGVAIYVCILVQFLYGWWWSRRERKRTRPHPTIPLKVHIHRLFGRAIAVLAFIQIALGLTLYGSPKVLFILYALAGALLLFTYMALEYRYKPRIGDGVAPSGARSDYYSDYSGSYLTGDQTEVTQDGRRRPREKHHWARNAFAAAGAFGAYEWWKSRRGRGKTENEGSEYTQSEFSRRQRPYSTSGPPGPGGPRPYTPSRPGQFPPGPGPGGRPPLPAVYSGNTPGSRTRRHDGALSPQSWENESEEDEKYGNRPQRNHTWRDRILGAGAGIAAFEGVKSIFGSKRRRRDDSDVSYRPGEQSMVSQTDVSRVEAGQAPFSPHDPRRNDRVPNADPMTPTRPGLRRRPSASSLTYDDENNYDGPQHAGGGITLRDSIATMGAIAGFREWNRLRKGRNERQRMDRIRTQELDEEQQFNRRNSNRYPRPQDASGRRQSLSGTVLTGPDGPDPVAGSNPELSRTQFRPDITQPPLPAAAGTLPGSSLPPPSSAGGYPNGFPHMMEQFQSQQQTMAYPPPPPPPGPPPPDALRPPAPYAAPAAGSLQMPVGAINPDPQRLLSQNNLGTAAAATAAGAGLIASQRTQSTSPSRRQGSRSRIPGRQGNGSVSQSQLDGASTAAGNAHSPPVSMKMNLHPDGRHVTLRRLSEEEAAAERAARKRERRSRRNSSLSSADDGASRYRRNNNTSNGGRIIRNSSQQPIVNVPPPPAMSSSAGGSHRPTSELNLPPLASRPGVMSQASDEPPHGAGLEPSSGPAGSGAVDSPGTDMGTGTDLSAFDNNRRRRRAERQRRLEASKGGNRVEFT